MVMYHREAITDIHGQQTTKTTEGIETGEVSSRTSKKPGRVMRREVHVAPCWSWEIEKGVFGASEAGEFAISGAKQSGELQTEQG